MTHRVSRISWIVGAVAVLFFASLAYWLFALSSRMMVIAKPVDTDHVKEQLSPALGDVTDQLTVVRVNRDVNAYYFVIKDREMTTITDRLNLVWDYEIKRSASGYIVITKQQDEDGREFIVVFETLGEGKIYGGYAVGETEHFWKSYESDKKYAR